LDYSQAIHDVKVDASNEFLQTQNEFFFFVTSLALMFFRILAVLEIVVSRPNKA